MRVLIAGIGNVLRGDDGFGPAVIDALNAEEDFEARAIDVGIGGIALVHELMNGYDALVVVDCMRRGGAPGSVYVVAAEVPAAHTIAATGDVALAMDMHDVGPDRALVVARAAGVLPPRVWIVGCEPGDDEELVLELSGPVRAALPRAVEAVRRLVHDSARDRTESVHGGR